MESTWFNIAGPDKNPEDKPRLLSSGEIDNLVSFLPTVRCTDREARETANNSLKKFLREELTSVYIAPSQLSNFKTELINRFMDARIIPSENVGISTADALGESSTQVALNTFHVGGAATAALVGIEGLKSLIFAYQPKNKSTIIHLTTRPKNFDETLATRKDLEGVSIGNLIEMSRFEIGTLGELGTPDWYEYFEMMGYKLPSSNAETMIMRMPLKLSKLIYYKISMTDLYQNIIDHSYGNHQSPIVEIVFSPFHVATIDLHLIAGKVSTSNAGLQRFAEMSFFRHTAIPVFDMIYIKGVPIIKKAYPVSFAVWEKSHSVVRPLYENELEEAKKLFPDSKNGKNIWYVKLDLVLMDKSGIAGEELTGLLDSLGLRYNINRDIMYVYNPFFSNDDDNLSTFIRERKSGMPFIKDQEFIETKKNKHVANANIRIYYRDQKYYITYDPAYIKYVLFHMKKRGFEWNLSNSIQLWRVIEYDNKLGESIVTLSFEKQEEGKNRKADSVHGFELSRYPDGLSPNMNNETLNDLITFYGESDFKRMFVLSTGLETYIYFHNRYEKEVRFHLTEKGYSWDNSPVNFKATLGVDISRGEKTIPNLSYKKIRAIYHDKVKELLKENQYEWGDEIPFKISVNTPIFYTKTNDSGRDEDFERNIKLYPLIIPQDVSDKIIKKIRKSDEFTDSVHQKYKEYVKLKDSQLSGKDIVDQISPDDIDDIDRLIMTTVTKQIRKVSAAKFYDHWFLTTKDAPEKKFGIYDTLSNPLVDSTRTYNNSLSEITAVLGVEAAYSYFIKALKDLNSASGNYIDPRHILMIADFIFSRGKPNTIQFTGLARQPIGHISLITVERAMEVLRKLAFTGNSENINTVSAAISTGQPTPGGTGMISISDSPKAQEQLLQFTKNAGNIRAGTKESQEAINKAHKGVFENVNIEKEGALPEYAYKLGKTYDSLQTLIADVLTDEEDILNNLGSGDYPEVILQRPDFNIVLMEEPKSLDSILGKPKQETIRKQKPSLKEDPKTVPVDPNVARVRKRGKFIRIPDAADLPQLDFQRIFQPITPSAKGNEYVNIDDFYDQLSKKH